MYLAKTKIKSVNEKIKMLFLIFDFYAVIQPYTCFPCGYAVSKPA